MAALTPLVFAIAMALVFRQVFALLMGLIGPAMVLGSWWESRRQAARTTALAKTAYARALAEYSRAVDEAQQRERARALEALPPLKEAVSQPLWRRTSLTSLGCRFGVGWAEVDQGHELWGTGAISGMPFVLDPTKSVALVGDESCAGIWRSLAVSWLLAASADIATPRIGELPHRIDGLSLAVWVDRPDDVPVECDVVILCGHKATVEVREEPGRSVMVVPDRLSHADATWILRRNGLLNDDAGAPLRDYSRRDQLWCSLSPERPEFDLVREGPHAVVWGATGSGKSVTVTAMVARLAMRYPPERLVCVLIDFKGGAGLRVLERLPHTVGSITDMDGPSVARALTGLHAELLRREKILHSHAVADIGELSGEVAMPRLMIVIDEAAWLLTNFPDFQTALSDVLARGRSLGVHVVISTQRITGVLTHAMMANISLRVCGRVSDGADALAWIPELSAASRRDVRHLHPGQVLLAGASLAPGLHIVSPTLPTMVEGARSSWRVWAEPLPTEVARSDNCWALVDDLTTGSHRDLGSEDVPQGSILILGDRGMGKTCALMVFASQRKRCQLAPVHPLELWLWWMSQRTTGATVVLDDIHNTLITAGLDGAQFLLDLLEMAPDPLLMASDAGSRHYRALSRLAHHDVILYVDKVETRTSLGGLDDAVPGRAKFRGETLQLSRVGDSLSRPRVPRIQPGPAAAIVTRTPEQWHGAPGVEVYSPEQLVLTWRDVCDTHDIVLDEISAMDIRQASAGRIHPPPLPVPEGSVLVWRRGQFFLARKAWWRG